MVHNMQPQPETHEQTAHSFRIRAAASKKPFMPTTIIRFPIAASTSC